MHGPSAAVTLEGEAPSAVMAATVASTTPSRAPFQPACAAPTTRACGIGEQNHPAIGAGDAKRQPRRRGDDAVAARALGSPPWRGSRHDVGGMHLIGHQQAIRIDPERVRHPRAVLGDPFACVRRSDARR